MHDIVKALTYNQTDPDLIQSYAFSPKRNVSVLQKVRSQFSALTGVNTYIIPISL